MRAGGRTGCFRINGPGPAGPLLPVPDPPPTSGRDPAGRLAVLKGAAERQHSPRRSSQQGYGDRWERFGTAQLQDDTLTRLGARPSACAASPWSPRFLTAARSCSTATAKPDGSAGSTWRMNGGLVGFAPPTIRKHEGRQTPPRGRLFRICRQLLHGPRHRRSL